MCVSGSANGTDVPGCGFGNITLAGQAPTKLFWYQQWDTYCMVDTFKVSLKDAMMFGPSTAIALDEVVVCPASANSTVTQVV